MFFYFRGNKFAQKRYGIKVSTNTLYFMTVVLKRERIIARKLQLFHNWKFLQFHSISVPRDRFNKGTPANYEIYSRVADIIRIVARFSPLCGPCGFHLGQFPFIAKTFRPSGIPGTELNDFAGEWRESEAVVERKI